MVLAYTTPHFGKPAMIAYAFVTNILLMTLYSANNMPYSALGAVMTGDVNERASLNSYRFIRQRRPIHRGRFHADVGRQIRRRRTQQATWLANDDGIWAVLCLVCS